MTILGEVAGICPNAECLLRPKRTVRTDLLELVPFLFIKLYVKHWTGVVAGQQGGNHRSGSSRISRVICVFVFQVHSAVKGGDQ